MTLARSLNRGKVNVTMPAQERVTVIISHRFSTVRLADQIVVLEDGAVSEMGSHASLLEQHGTYAQMYRLQARGYSETTSTFKDAGQSI